MFWQPIVIIVNPGKVYNITEEGNSVIVYTKSKIDPLSIVPKKIKWLVCIKLSNVTFLNKKIVLIVVFFSSRTFLLSKILKNYF